MNERDLRELRRAQAKAMSQGLTYVLKHPGKSAWVISLACLDCQLPPYILYIPPMVKGIQ